MRRRLGPALDGAVAVDDHFSQIAQQPGRAVAPVFEAEQLWGLVDEARRTGALDELRMADDVVEKGEVGGDAPDAEFDDRPLHPPHRLFERRRPGCHLLQQRVVERRDPRAGIGGAAVKAYAEPGGAAIVGEHAVIRNKIIFRILGGHPALHGVAVHPNLVLTGDSALGRADGGPVCDADLRLHQVDACHHLGDRVLDLDARIDLDEVERACVVVDQKLDGAGVVVAHRAAYLERALVDRRAGLPVEIMRGRLLDDFLVAPLHRAVPLVEMHQVAVVVPQNLDLDVARAANQLFEIDLVVPERRQALAPRGLDRIGEFGFGLDRAHAAPAAAPARLEHNGKTDFAGETRGLTRVAGERACRRNHRNVRRHREFPRRHLVAECAHDIGLRADEDDACGSTRLGEVGVLGQEAVARVDRIGSVLARNAHHLVDAEVGLYRAHPPAHLVGFVGLESVQREAVLLRVDRDRFDPEFDRGAEHADGDFAPVGDEDPAEICLRLVDHVVPFALSRNSCPRMSEVMSSMRLAHHNMGASAPNRARRRLNRRPVSPVGGISGRKALMAPFPPRRLPVSVPPRTRPRVNGRSANPPSPV